MGIISVVRRIRVTLAVVTLVGVSFGVSRVAQAVVTLNVDSAPNVYGSSDWAPWWTAAKTDVVAGTFTDMRTGTHPGTHQIDPYDEIVYSTGDLGKRVHWIYWLPGETVAGLSGRFEVKWAIDWDGTDYTYDWNINNWVLDSPTAGWVEPGSWEDYAGGVIGSFGFAWWASDDDAPPGNTDGNPYNETNQADIDALRLDVLDFQTYAVGSVRHRATVNEDWQVSSLRLEVVPAPGAAILAMIGMGMATRLRRRFGRA